MSTVTINFNHGGADLILEVDYDFTPGQKETPQTFDSGGEPAVGPEVAINSVLCVEVDEEDGPKAIHARLAEIIGEMCWQANKREITDKTFEAACEQERDDGPDPDMLREAQQERQEMAHEHRNEPGDE